MEHGKIEENTVNSGIFNGWGDSEGKANVAQKQETHSKNTGFGGLSRRRCLAI